MEKSININDIFINIDKDVSIYIVDYNDKSTYRKYKLLVFQIFYDKVISFQLSFTSLDSIKNNLPKNCIKYDNVNLEQTLSKYIFNDRI